MKLFPCISTILILSWSSAWSSSPGHTEQAEEEKKDKTKNISQHIDSQGIKNYCFSISYPAVF